MFTQKYQHCIKELHYANVRDDSKSDAESHAGHAMTNSCAREEHAEPQHKEVSHE